ncbi:SbcC/MukB-like Walker B domain-containing protein [Halomarina rubra]|uniref:SbcC/MukB-like Walker B domain-containing protein n=1 Tax=Halomarina rubra TaxID=2071873 RepID=A0ABD6AX87_9EURY|nr:AAA family ATPase [Halomarina rubra]
MKISRIHASNFGIDEFPTIEEESVEGDDLLIFGGNRSGKSLSFNALLYGLYGADATYGISPGRNSDVKIHFDDGSAIDRSGSPHEFRNEGEVYVAKNGVRRFVGRQELVSLQFLHSEVGEQPLSVYDGDELVQHIRRALNSELQQEIERHRLASTHLKNAVEMARRGEKGTSLRELNEEYNGLGLESKRSRLEKVKHLESLIESGKVESIIERLQREDEISSRIEDLYDEKRHIEQQLRKLQRQLREEKRYTDKINDIIIDAISEFACPVCDRLVEESTAKHRLKRGQCPQCGRPRSLSDLKEDIGERVESADGRIESLEDEIEELESREEEIEEEISSLKEQEPDLSELNSLVRTAIKEADYNINTLISNTDDYLTQYQESVEELENRKAELEEEISTKEDTIEVLSDSQEHANELAEKLSEQSFDEVIDTFRERWSDNYSSMAPELGTEIRLTTQGDIRIPGTDSEGPRDYSRVSGGEKRLMNLSFVFTLAQFAQQGDTEHSFETLVMDEPLTNLEDDVQESALEFLIGSSVQVIMTTPAERLKEPFTVNQIVSLDRIELEQMKLDAFA